MRLVDANKAKIYLSLAACEQIKYMPTEDVISTEELLEKIHNFKHCFKSGNGDYLSGYMDALSAVEELITDTRNKEEK